MNKRTVTSVLAAATLFVGVAAFGASTLPDNLVVQGSVTCTSITNTGSTDYTEVNAANGSADVLDYTGTLGIMNGSDTFQLFDINITNANHTGGSNFVYVFDIAGITQDAQARETAILIGTGWDYALDIGANPILGGAADAITIGGSDATFTFTRNDAGAVTFSGADDAGAADTIYDTTGTGAVTVGSADVTGVTLSSDGGTLDTATANTLTLTALTTNAATFIGADAASPADTVFDTTGAGAITVGSADVTSITLTTDGTGTGEVVLPLQSVAGAEMVNDTVGGDQLADSITLDAATTISGSYDFTAGTAGNEAAVGNVAVERCMGAICQTVMTLTAVNVVITDPGAAAAYGGTLIYDFPEGRILALGVVADLTATEASATIVDDWDGDIAFGTDDADAGAGLAGDEVDWVPSTATTQAVGSVAATDCASIITDQIYHDGHTTAIDLYVNFEIDDADISTGGADAITVSGTVTVTWINLGDN